MYYYDNYDYLDEDFLIDDYYDFLLEDYNILNESKMAMSLFLKVDKNKLNEKLRVFDEENKQKHLKPLKNLNKVQLYEIAKKLNMKKTVATLMGAGIGAAIGSKLGNKKSLDNNKPRKKLTKLKRVGGLSTAGAAAGNIASLDFSQVNIFGRDIFVATIGPYILKIKVPYMTEKAKIILRGFIINHKYFKNVDGNNNNNNDDEENSYK